MDVTLAILLHTLLFCTHDYGA